jgi:Zn-dependent protease with chaperone function
VSEKQFGDIYIFAQNTCERLGLEKTPDIYIYNMDGIFNAFATHFFSRNFVILTTAILGACDNDIQKISFVVAHELVHLQRGHTRKQFFLFPSTLIPWLGNAYSRACEYTCDGVAGKFIIGNKEQAIQ